ncbi:LysR family transcriptional regulator [Dyella sp.]|uniref:LysR family transcriptional regulator n=1 Tax=Dyella sp. TaxID=1869338 RepID=UPI002ED0F1D4
MLKLDPLQTFVEVVRAKGFSSAAQRIGMPRSTVSLQVKALEETLGTRLLKRSTRSLALTDEGRRLFESASGAIDVLAHALEDVRGESGVLRGLIRITAPADFPTRILATAITEFRQQYPQVRFELTLTNAVLDLVRENVDIAIRAGSPAGMDSVERTLFEFSWRFHASAEWVALHGKPASIDAIASFIAPTPLLRAYLERTVLGGQTLPAPAIEVDSQFLARDLVLQDFGIGLLPEGLFAQADIDKGNIVALLDETIRQRSRMNLTFPTRADMLPRVRAFADHLCGLFDPVD